jgi:hypothetical protein
MLLSVQTLLTLEHAYVLGKATPSLSKIIKCTHWLIGKTLYTAIVKINGKNATKLANKTVATLEPLSNKIHTIA